MSDYERSTATPLREVFAKAHEILTSQVEMERTRDGRHSVTYIGGEGTVTLDAHRHGLHTIVTARTNQLRTSRLDEVVRYLMNQLPYQPGDPARRAYG